MSFFNTGMMVSLSDCVLTALRTQFSIIPTLPGPDLACMDSVLYHRREKYYSDNIM